ncbi:MAG: hypothetical protein R3C56_12605 [Pirellulaceae bacterium]
MSISLARQETGGAPQQATLPLVRPGCLYLTFHAMLLGSISVLKPIRPMGYSTRVRFSDQDCCED